MPGFVKFANNVSTRLVSPVLASDNTFQVEKLPSGISWPVLTEDNSDWFLVTIVEPSSGTWEICKSVVNVNTSVSDYDTLTVIRAVEGTTASDYPAGSIVENRVTAESLNQLADPPLWYPTVDFDGIISWSYSPSASSAPSETVIMGPKGDPGDPSEAPQWDLKADKYHTQVDGNDVVVDCEYNFGAIGQAAQAASDLLTSAVSDIDSQIVELNDKIAAMEGNIGFLQAYDFGDPSIVSGTGYEQPWWDFSDPRDGIGSWQQALTAYAVQQVPSWATGGVPNAVAVTNLFDGKVWYHNADTSTWVNSGQEGVAPFTQQLAGVIRGSTKFGYVSSVTENSANVGKVVGLSTSQPLGTYLSGQGTYSVPPYPSAFSTNTPGLITGSSGGDGTVSSNNGVGTVIGFDAKLAIYEYTPDALVPKPESNKIIYASDGDEAREISANVPDTLVVYPVSVEDVYRDLPVLAEVECPYTPRGYLDTSVDNGLLLRADYPDAWKLISTRVGISGDITLQTETSWLQQLASYGYNPNYSSGDGSTTFRIPYVPVSSSQEVELNVLFPGAIIAFSGTFVGRNPVPLGGVSPKTDWLICDGGSDGQGGTVPDLSNVFILGTSVPGMIGTTGGATSHVHTVTGTVDGTAISVAQMPSHNHSVSAIGSGSIYGLASVEGAWNGPVSSTGYTGSGQAHTHSISNSSGTGSASNTPPYYTLAYIIKVA